MADDFFDFMTSGGDELINGRKSAKTGKWIPPEKADRIKTPGSPGGPTSMPRVAVIVWGIIIIVILWTMLRGLFNG